MYDKCPNCGYYVIYDSFSHEYVCPNCGTVVCDRPLVYDVRRHFSGGVIDNDVIVVDKVVLKNTWLSAGIELVDKMRGVVYSDYCTQKTSINLLREIYNNMDKYKLPDYTAVAKYVVLIASRKCSEHVDVRKLFKSINEIYKLTSTHKYLRQLYTPLTLREQAVNIAVNTIKCLEKHRVLNNNNIEEITETIKTLAEKTTISTKPRTLAIALVYTACLKHGYKIKTTYLTTCTNTTKNIVKRAIEKHTKKLLNLF